MINEINVSFLLSEEEAVERAGVIAVHNKSSMITVFYCLFGLYFIVPAAYSLFTGGNTQENVIWILIGVAIASFYDLFVLRVFAKRRARREYQININRKASYTAFITKGCIKITSDRYCITAKPQDYWKCIETTKLFLLFVGCGEYLTLPKRVLTENQITQFCQLLKEALPENMYVSYGK